MQLCAKRWKYVQMKKCNYMQIYANMCTYVRICPNQIVHLCANMCRHFPGFFRNYQVVIQVTHYDLSVWCHIWSRLCRAQNASAQLWSITRTSHVVCCASTYLIYNRRTQVAQILASAFFAPAPCKSFTVREIFWNDASWPSWLDRTIAMRGCWIVNT